jgi:murein DD-endopeptidase MepM/ murein hydrolase activator NlpD
VRAKRALDREVASLQQHADALRLESATIASLIRNRRGGADQPIRAGRLSLPASCPVTSRFGPRWGRMHEGIDLGCPDGEPVRAAGPGTVTFSGWQGGYGKLVILDHGGGLATAYAHHSRLAVSAGQSVARGQVIGEVGSTGHSTGPHLHFEVRIDGNATDPVPHLA